MPRKKRKTEETYYDMLNWFFNRAEYMRLSASEIGLMAYIMHYCNLNYGNECTIDLNVLAVKTSADVRRLPDKLQTLAKKNYIEIAEIEKKVWQISVKCQTFANEQQDAEPISDVREEKIRQEEKVRKGDYNFFKNEERERKNQEDLKKIGKLPTLYID